MQEQRRISSPRNPRLQPYRAIARGRHGRRRSPWVLVEGVRLTEAALDAGLRPHEVLLAPRLEQGARGRQLAERLRQSADGWLEVSDRVLETLSQLATPQGVMALFPYPKVQQPQRLLTPPGPLLIACELQDPGNLGVLMRSADAAEAAGLVCLGGLDPWSPRVLRASAGAAFRLPVLPLAYPGELPDWLLHTRRLFATTPHHGQELYTLELGRPFALLLGSEAHGLPDELLRLSQPLRVPMRAGVESLNVASAATVVLYEALRQRCRLSDLSRQRA